MNERRDDPIGLIDQNLEALMSGLWHAVEELSEKHLGYRVPFAVVLAPTRENTCMATNVPAEAAYLLMLRQIKTADYTATIERNAPPKDPPS